jgi:predicted nucleic acid-binding protein
VKIVLDTNILISALIRDSATRKLIVEMDEELAYPEAGIREIHKYKNFILEKSGLSEKEFTSVFDLLLDYIELVPDDVLENAIEEAKELMLEIDEKT